MRKTKIEQRVKNAFDAFFDENFPAEDNAIVYTENKGFLLDDVSPEFIEKADVLVKVLKQVFLFLPGTFMLSNLILILTTYVFNPPAFTIIFHSEKLILMLLISALMTLIGLGDIKNPRHLIIPGSIALLAFAAGVILALSGGSMGIAADYGVYLLPAALVVPYLVKNWADKRESFQ